MIAQLSVADRLTVKQLNIGLLGANEGLDCHKSAFKQALLNKALDGSQFVGLQTVWTRLSGHALFG